MDPHLLQTAAANGDVASLRAVLQHNSIALHEMVATSTVDTPLLIAASYGHHEFVREVVLLMPNLARQNGKQGAYPLHMAAASGHVRVAAELLKVDGQELCRLRDKDGRMPIHIAALLGEVDVLEKLIEADPDSLQETTGRGETVLHLSVKAHQINVVKFLSESPCFGSLLNMQDEKGNTALHLAAAVKSTEISKVLLGTPGIHVNVKNGRGETPIDVLPLLCNEALVVEIGQIILAAGGSGNDSSVEQITQAANSVDQLQTSNHNREEEEKEDRTTPKEWLKEMHSSLMVVAALVATISFQAAVTPPGGFYEPDPAENGTVDAGQRVRKVVLDQSRAYHGFMVCDFIGFTCSIVAVNLLLSREIKEEPFLIDTLVYFMNLSIIFMWTAFCFLFSAIVPKVISSLRLGLQVLLVALVVPIFYLGSWMKLVHKKWLYKYFVEKVGVDKSTAFGKIISILLPQLLPVFIGIFVADLANELLNHLLLPRIST